MSNISNYLNSSHYIECPKVIMFFNVNMTYSFPDQVTSENKTYELRYCYFIFEQSNNKFDAQVFARHGNIFSKW